jgi:hypothetical protein
MVLRLHVLHVGAIDHNEALDVAVAVETAYLAVRRCDAVRVVALVKLRVIRKMPAIPQDGDDG